MITSWITVFFMGINLWMQSVYFRGFQMYGRLGTAFSMQADVGAYSSSIQEFISPQDYAYVFIPLVLGILFVLIKFFVKTDIEASKLNVLRVASLLIFVMALLQFQSSLKTAASQTVSIFEPTNDAEIYQDVVSTVQFVEHFGLIGLLQRDISSLVYEPILIKASDQPILLKEWLNKLELFQTSSSHGVLENQNVLVIQAESLMNLAIDPVLTPTLALLKKEGIVMSGYDAPLMFGSTADTEFMANTSLVPPNNGLVAYIRYSDHVYPTTLAKVFSDEGYQSLAFHNNEGSFYERSNMLPILGYQFYDPESLGFVDPSIGDVEMAQAIVKALPSQPFFAYWITLDGHQPYGIDSLPQAYLRFESLVNMRFPALSESEKVYFMKAMVLDEAIQTLMEGLKTSNQLEDTLIVVMGDHAAKGVFTHMEDVRQVSDEANAQDTPLIFYSSKLGSQTITKPTTALDLAPTLFDLMGFDSASVMLGQSLFSEDYQGFNFNQWGDIKIGSLSYLSQTNSILNPENLDKDVVNQRILDAKQFLNKGSQLVELDAFAP